VKTAYREGTKGRKVVKNKETLEKIWDKNKNKCKRKAQRQGERENRGKKDGQNSHRKGKEWQVKKEMR
jgi:hypothetical protein